MQPIEEINLFLKDYFHTENFTLHPITDSASDRKYFRVRQENKSYIVTYSSNIPETKTFLYFSELFRKDNLPVPEILSVHTTLQIYLQEDVGDQNLLSLLEKQGESTEIKKLYKKSLDELIKLQFLTSKKIDFSHCYDFSSFDETLIYNDLNYFKFYFFQPLEIPFSNHKLLKEFTSISQKIAKSEPQGFVYRDFQSRNIMVQHSQPFFIDYQGGMKGNPVYDLVSLLWQAKAQLSEEFKQELKEYYFSQVHNLTNVSKDQLEEIYQYCLLIRLLQVLGAYGFRGILQKKQHFVNSIFFGINNLKIYNKENNILASYPELSQIITTLLTGETEKKINILIEK